MRSQTLLRAILTLLVVYFSTFGMTFNGILIPELRWVTLAIVLVGLSAWFITHYRAKWIWHRSPLDMALILWMVIIGVSILANIDTWRRSANGIWFVVGYVLLWYMLSDWLMNNRLQRTTLIDSVIMGGMAIVFFGYLQFLTALGRGEIARVGSLVGNPNSLGAFLLMLLTFIVGRIFTLKNRTGRRLLIGYALATAILLGITFSRGALAGGAISTIIVIALNLPRDFWGKIKPQTARSRLIWGLGGFATLLIGIGVVFIMVRSFSLAGRSADLRIDIYANALTIFADSPITGHGLFTFGREFATQQSQPPQQPHSHAHNGVLLVMAELGILGLAILSMTVITVLMMMRHNWREADIAQRRLLAIGIAGSIGFGVHHLLDFPAMMPLIAISGLIPIALAVIPYQPKPLQACFRVIGHPVAMFIGSIVFIGWGGWVTSVYGNYTALVARPFVQNADMTYTQVADALQSIINADPAMAWYINQQAYLYALGGDDASAIQAYQSFLASEPTHSISWVNLARVYWRMGDVENAIDAQRQAVSLAPKSFPFAFTLGEYLEATGDTDGAYQAYLRALHESTASWHEWDETPFRQAVLATLENSDSHQLITALADDQPASLIALWENSLYRTENSTRAKILWLMVALREGEVVDTAQQIHEAKSQIRSVYDEAWVLLGQAWIARHEGDVARYNDLSEQAQNKIARKINQEDVSFATNIPYFQFLVASIPRQLLPDVFYPIPDAPLRRLLED